MEQVAVNSGQRRPVMVVETRPAELLKRKVPQAIRSKIVTDDLSHSWDAIACTSLHFTIESPERPRLVFCLSLGEGLLPSPNCTSTPLQYMYADRIKAGWGTVRHVGTNSVDMNWGDVLQRTGMVYSRFIARRVSFQTDVTWPNGCY